MDLTTQLDAHAAECRSCGADIIWAHTPAGKRQPLDPTAAQTIPRAGAIRLIAIGPDLMALPAAPGDPPPFYVSHFASCPDAGAWRTTTVREHERRVPPPRPVTPPPAERAARDAGMERAHQSLGEPFRDWARGALRALAAAGAPFNADDLERLRAEEDIPPPPTRAGIGPMFAAAERRGEIRRTGERRPMAGQGAHARLTDLWIGTDKVRSGDTDTRGTG